MEFPKVLTASNQVDKAGDTAQDERRERAMRLAIQPIYTGGDENEAFRIHKEKRLQVALKWHTHKAGWSGPGCDSLDPDVQQSGFSWSGWLSGFAFASSPDPLPSAGVTSGVTSSLE